MTTQKPKFLKLLVFDLAKICNFEALYLGAERSSAAKNFFSHDNLGVTYHHAKFHFETPRSPEDPPLLITSNDNEHDSTMQEWRNSSPGIQQEF